MKTQILALKAELLKIKYSSIVWVTFIAFALAPIMGGVFMIIMQNPDALAKASALNTKAQATNFTVSWNSYLGMLTQAIGVGGVLIFGFVASWIFGREYSDSTAKDLMSLPTSRTTILNAKFVLYSVWCFALALSNLFVGWIIILALDIPAPEINSLFPLLQLYFNTTVLTILLGLPIAFFAIWGKGFMAPLGFVALTLVFSQIIAATGYGYYFPWAIPGLYSGSGGEYKLQLNTLSYTILILTSVLGYYTTVLYWKYSDQKK